MNNNQPAPEATFTVRHYTESERLRRIAAEKQKIAMDELWKLSVAKNEGRAEGEAMGIAKGRAEGRAEGEAMGIAKGRAEGRAEAISETTKMFIANLRAMGMSEAQIQMALGKPTADGE